MVNMCLLLIYELDKNTSHPLEILDRYWVFYVEVILMTFATLIERDEKTVYPAKYKFVHMHWGLGCLVIINLYMA